MTKINEITGCIITIPKKIGWDDYEKELKMAFDFTHEMNYKIGFWPKVQPGQKCFVVHDGQIKGWMQITAIGKIKSGFVCTATGLKWAAGIYIKRSGPFNLLLNKIEMKGFRGLRYIYSDNGLGL